MLDDENVYALLKTSEIFLKSKGLPEPKFDAEVLLSFVLQVKRSKLPSLRDKRPTYEQILQYEKCVSRRSNREPSAYITGHVGFMDFEFKVNKNVLIPRPETEFLVELALKIAKEEDKKSVLDLCTGSGCIAISLSNLGNFKKIVASDISVCALEIARENAHANACPCIKFVASDIFKKISYNKFDIIVSNPPYVTEMEYVDLEPELKFEPKDSLVAKDEGLFFYKNIASHASKFLNNKGYVMLELNSNKFDEIRQIFVNGNYKNIEVINDYSGLPRILKAEKV